MRADLWTDVRTGFLGVCLTHSFSCQPLTWIGPGTLRALHVMRETFKTCIRRVTAREVFPWPNMLPISWCLFLPGVVVTDDVGVA